MFHPEMHRVSRVFESRPLDTATWFIALDSIGAIHRVLKDKKVIELPAELAAQRVVKTLGNGDYRSMERYVTRPDIYPPGMTSYVTRLGARSIKGNLDPALMAVLTYKTDRAVKSNIDHHIAAFELSANAEGFRGYFISKAEDAAASEAYPSLLDLTLAIKNDTSFWIDKEATI